MILRALKRNRQLRCQLRLQRSQNNVLADKLQVAIVKNQAIEDKNSWLDRQIQTEQCAYKSLKLRADALDSDLLDARRKNRDLERQISELRTANQKQLESNASLADKLQLFIKAFGPLNE